MENKSVSGFLKTHLFLVFSLAAAFVSTAVLRPSPRFLLTFPDYRVLGILFAFMTVIRGFCDARLPDAAALIMLKKCRRTVPLYLVLTALVFFFSMIVTNDVALLTFVPLTLTVCRYLKIDPIRISVIETVAANLGSALTPMGNPQNLYLYSYYHLAPAEFFSLMLPLSAVSLAALSAAAVFAARRDSGNGMAADGLPAVPEVRIKESLVCSILLFVILAAVFRQVDYRWAVGATVVGITVFCPRVWIGTDYSLLAVFAALFVFTGNLASVPVLKSALPRFLETEYSACFSAAVLSQVVSNVPAALMIAPFTDLWRPVLIGVNLGGLGTLIASLASVITYQFYIGEQGTSAWRYLRFFTVCNLLFLFLLIPVVLLIL